MLERMHAVVQQAFGGPEVLEVAEIDRPVPLATEVLVRVEAVGVNPVEPLAELREAVLVRLMEQRQLLDPFGFLVYAEQVGAELSPVR